jgi:hypothetical protein
MNPILEKHRCGRPVISRRVFLRWRSRRKTQGATIFPLGRLVIVRRSGPSTKEKSPVLDKCRKVLNISSIFLSIDSYFSIL